MDGQWHGLINFKFVLLVLLPIPICLLYHTNEVLRSYWQFILLTYLIVSHNLFLYCKGVWDVLHNVISQCCEICFIDSIKFNIMHQWYHTITGAIKYKQINLIKLFTWCSFICKQNNATVFEGDQNRAVCAVNSRLLSRLLNVGHTRIPELLQHISTCYTYTCCKR